MKVTKRQFEIFEREIKKWINLFGLNDWEIYIEQDDLEEDVEATCQWDKDNRLCYMKFAKAWDNDSVKLTPKEIRATAFHEVLHLLFADIHDMAHGRYVVASDIDAAIHAIIKNLQNFFTLKNLIR